MLAEKSQQAMCGVTVEQVEVMIYDILTKLASNGKIADVLSNSTDLADCGRRLQQVSDDVSSGISNVAERPGGQLSEVPGRQRQTAEADGDVFMDQVDGMFSVSGVLDDFIPMTEEGDLDAVIPRMKRNEGMLGPKQGKRRRCKRGKLQQPDVPFPFIYC